MVEIDYGNNKVLTQRQQPPLRRRRRKRRRLTTIGGRIILVSFTYCPWIALSFLGWACYRFFYYTSTTTTTILSSSPGRSVFNNTAFLTTKDNDVYCKYDGNCPIGMLCNYLDDNDDYNNDGSPSPKGICKSYVMDGSSSTSRSSSNIRSPSYNINQTRFEHCISTCLEELKVDEWFLQDSIPKLQSSQAPFGMNNNGEGVQQIGISSGCVLYYQRQEKTNDDQFKATTNGWMQYRFRRVVRVDPFTSTKSSSSLSKDNNDIWMAYCHDPCTSTQDCSIGYKCEGRQKCSSLLLPKIKSKPKSCVSATQHTTPIPDMYIVSGANNDYFEGLKNLAASLLYWSPQRKLIVYNLGMSQEQLMEIQSWSNVQKLYWKDEDNGIPEHYPNHVRTNLKNYAWKSIVINETVHEYKSILWVDAGSTFVGPVDSIEEILQRHGLFLARGQDDNMKWKSHEDMYKWFGYTKETFNNHHHGGPSYAGNIQGYVYPSRYIDSIVIPNAKCALDETCIAPPGSNLQNHRYDQSSLSILAYNPKVRAPHYTEYLAAGLYQLNTNLSLPSTKYILWTSRGSCQYYSQNHLQGLILKN